MSIKRVSILLVHEVKSSLKSFFFFQAILTPLILSLVTTLVFGRLFLGTPDLGFLKDESSEMVELMNDDVNIHLFDTEDDLFNSVESGTIDMGIILPEAFDSLISENRNSTLTIYFWGNTSLIKRTHLTNTFSHAIKTISNRNFPIRLSPRYLNKVKAKPWFNRMLPLLVILAIMMSGLLIPSTSMVNEKQKGTIDALIVTPVSYYEIQLSKTLYGFFLSVIMGIVILLINSALPEKWGLFLIVLSLGSLLASTVGSLFGYAGKNILSVMNLIKSLMMIFYAPAILNFFVSIPDWIQKIFPTYYIYGPLIKLSRDQFSLEKDSWEIFCLLAIVLALQFWLFKLVNKRSGKFH